MTAQRKSPKAQQRFEAVIANPPCQEFSMGELSIEGAAYVYVIRVAGRRIKVGRSKHPEKRVQVVARSSGFKVLQRHISIPVVDASGLELAVHSSLGRSRRIGEWFIHDYQAACDLVDSLAASYRPWCQEEEDRFKRKKVESERCLAELIDGMFPQVAAARKEGGHV